MGKEAMRFDGRILFSALPPDDWTEAAFARFWVPMPWREKQRYLAHEEHNLLTSAGRLLLLEYIASSGGSAIPFTQYFALGSMGTNQLSPGDTSVLGEIFRTTSSGQTYQGNQLDIQVLIGTTQAVGTLTNAGIYGNNATATAGSGTLYTHALISNFSKASTQAYAVDYLVNLS